MNSTLLGGSDLAGTGRLAAVANARAGHRVWALFHVARGTSLEGGGSFSPGPYGADPAGTEISLVLRALLWLAILPGFALVAWGELGGVDDRRHGRPVTPPAGRE